MGKCDPSSTDPCDSEDAAKAETLKRLEELRDLQLRLYAGRERSVLVVLQGLDASGKDGTIHHVMSAFNPQGATVAAFKVPTAEEAAHDFLWRVHACAPGAGTIAIFNRSHYEDVLVTRVHGTIDKAECKRRYAAILDFERLLTERGTCIVKFFLNIGKAEQLRRFGQRLDDPKRNWKISESDYGERAYWDDYVNAYEDALRATSTKHAPWYVIPANHKWFRNLAVANIVAHAMRDLKLKLPKPAVDLDEIRRKYHEAENGA